MARSRTAKATVLASGRGLTQIVAMVGAIVMVRVLTKEDYATYRMTFLVFNFAAPILTLGLSQALFYFLPGEERRARGILLENVLPLACMAAIFSLFILAGGNRLVAARFGNPALATTLLVMIPYALFTLPRSSLGACLIARERVTTAAIFNVASRCFTLTLLITACLLWRTASAAIVAMVAGTAVVSLFAYWLMLRTCQSDERRPTWAGVRRQLAYAVPLGLAAMLATISRSLDKMIVASMCSTEDFAVYAVGAREVPLIGILTGSAMAVIIPDLARMAKDGWGEEAMELWRRAATKCALVIFPVTVALLVLAPEFIRTLFSADYDDSAYPFRVYLVALPIRISMFGALLMALRKNRLILLRTAIQLVLNLCLTLLMVRWLGYIGAAVATVAVILLWSVPFNLVTIAQAIGVSVRSVVPGRELLRIAVVAVAASVVFLPRPCLDLGSDAVNLVVYGAGYAFLIAIAYICTGLVRLDRLLDRVEG